MQNGNANHMNMIMYDYTCTYGHTYTSIISFLLEIIVLKHCGWVRCHFAMFSTRLEGDTTLT